MKKKFKKTLKYIILICTVILLIGCNKESKDTLSEKELVYCSNCGAESYEESEYCSNCGMKAHWLNETPEVDNKQPKDKAGDESNMDNEKNKSDKDKIKNIYEGPKVDIKPEEPPKYTNPVEPPVTE